MLDSRELQLLYYTLIVPYMQYCDVVWSLNYMSRLNGVVKLQKRIIRIIAKANYYEHTNKLFKLFKILKFNDLVYFHTAIFMYKVYHGQTITKLCNIFQLINNQHCYGTRQTMKFYCNYARIDLRKYTLFIKGPKIWNELNNDIVNSSTLKSFKLKLKKFLVDKY